MGPEMQRNRPNRSMRTDKTEHSTDFVKRIHFFWVGVDILKWTNTNLPGSTCLKFGIVILLLAAIIPPHFMHLYEKVKTLWWFCFPMQMKWHTKVVRFWMLCVWWWPDPNYWTGPQIRLRDLAQPCCRSLNTGGRCWHNLALVNHCDAASLTNCISWTYRKTYYAEQKNTTKKGMQIIIW